MKNRLLLLIKYLLFWLIYFWLVRTLFWTFNWPFTKGFLMNDYWKIYFWGFRLDISSASYISALPFLLTIATVFLGNKFLKHIINWYTYFVIVVVSILVVADIEMYKYWYFRLDATPFFYLKTPKEAMASTDYMQIILLLVFMIVLSICSIYLYKKLTQKIFSQVYKGRWFEFPLFLFVSALLIIPIRGGFGMPLNTGSAYYSKQDFANHAAINVFWNVAYSITEMKKFSNPYKEMDEQLAAKMVSDLYTNNNSEYISLLNNSKPNIVLIVVESFTSKLIEPLGGDRGVTPCFNKLMNEGVLFQNLYSSGVRSDKGLVGLLSGFPSIPAVAIMRFPDKNVKLPNLTRDLTSAGYNSAFYYGGDIDFASMRSYFTNAGFEKIIHKSDFPLSANYARWGVHDHIVFDRFLNDLNTAQNPFFYSVFTLSSHEPFDVPKENAITSDDLDLLFINSVHYTDSCLGDFIEKAKKTSWWKNSLVIITADHGAIKPYKTPNYDPKRFKIPMLWLGGALRITDTVISPICSQTDIAFTLLKQLRIEPKQIYKYSRNIMSHNQKEFAYCVFNNGYAIFSDSVNISYDLDGRMIKIKEGPHADSVLNLGRAYLQTVYDDFLK